jgi:hypothetical protein
VGQLGRLQGLLGIFLPGQVPSLLRELDVLWDEIKSAASYTTPSSPSLSVASNFEAMIWSLDELPAEFLYFGKGCLGLAPGIHRR